MDVNDFRKKLSINSRVMIDNQQFNIKEIIKFRIDDGSYYLKCFLNDGYILAEDAENNNYNLLKEIQNDIDFPFPSKIMFKNKNYIFLYEAHATAEKIDGKGVFKVGDSERFWDYKSEDGSYLSLGINDQTKKRMDCIGKIIEPSKLNLKYE